MVINSLQNFDETDVLAVLIYVLGGIVTTAGLIDLYGYDVTQSFAGVAFLTVPFVLMAGSIAFVVMTNSISTDDLFDDFRSGKSLGFALAVHLPLFSAWDPTFYTNVVGSPEALLFVMLGVVGIVLLSDDGVN